MVQMSESMAYQVKQIRDKVVKSIIELMESHNVTEVDFMLDFLGRDCEDDEYDVDWVKANRIWCATRHTDYSFVSSIELDKYSDDCLTIYAEGEDFTCNNVNRSVELYIDILARLELMWK